MNARPAILTVSVIAFQVYMQEIGVKPRFLAGHSLGEYSALVCAGALSFHDAVTLVRRREFLCKMRILSGRGDGRRDSAPSSNIARNMFESVDGRISRRCRLHEFRPAACDFRTSASCGTCHQDSGGKGAKYTYLNVSAPFHSSMIRSASEQFQTVLHLYSFRDAAWPIISNVTTHPYSAEIRSTNISSDT